MKKIFLIDTENIGKTFLEPAAKHLTTSDILVVFNNQIRRNDFSQAILDGFSKIKASIKKIYLESATKNAMDFGIMCELGRLMQENGNTCEYYIVSNDRAFDVATDMAKASGISTKVKRISTLDKSYDEEGRIKEEEAQIRQLLPDTYSKRVVKTVQQAFDASPTMADFIIFIHHHLWHDRKDILARVDALAHEKYDNR